MDLRPRFLGPPPMDERPIQVSHALGFDLSGHVLDDRYQITRKIGTGGMAVVYEARRIGLDRRFALKILRPELAEHESNVKRFLREARSAAAIEHANIVSIVDVGESSRPVYFVMEFLDGADLRHVIRTQGRQSWPRTRERGLQIVAALAAAHARGIVHRDVKPANCFLVRDDSGRERVKVLDFGIAKVLEESQEYTNVTATHGIVGTVAYMAPEQARSGTIDKRTDVYALGTMLYEMLAGTVPFPDKNPFVALSRQLAEAPRPLREHRPDLTPEVEAIVMTCLAKDPDERFQSMEALGGALEAVAGDPVVWTGPMPAAPGATPTEPATPGAFRPAVRTEVLPFSTEPSPTRDATPTFPLPVPDADAPVAHVHVAAATSTSAASPPHGVVGLIFGALGMLALGGTITWWALHQPTEPTPRDPVRAIEADSSSPNPPSPPVDPQRERPQPTDTTSTPDRTPPDARPPELTSVDAPPDTSASGLGDPRPRPRPKTPTPDAKLPPPDPVPPSDTKMTPHDGKNPVAPGLRNPFTGPKPAG